jgi:hypothetical protein
LSYSVECMDGMLCELHHKSSRNLGLLPIGEPQEQVLILEL